MTSKKGFRLGPQRRRKGAAESDLPLCFNKRRLDGGEQRRQFGIAPGVAGFRRGAVAAVLQAIAIARLAAALSNRANVQPLPPRGRRFVSAMSARILHSGRILPAVSVLISAEAGWAVIPWVALAKIISAARG